MKFLFKWIFLITRAVLRFLFIDMGGEGYLKAEWKPSRDRWTHFSYGPEHDPDGLYDESWHGEDFPGIFILPALALGVVTLPIWLPMLLWEISEGQRKQFLKWIGADQ